MQSGNALGRMCPCVCLSVCPVYALILECLDLDISFWYAGASCVNVHFVK